jgi:hypothetical protein
MAECTLPVSWNPVPPNSKLCAQASAKKGTKPSDDYNAGVVIAKPGGGVITWTVGDLDPGPSHLSPLLIGGYGVFAKLYSGPSGPIVTLHIWIETPDGKKPKKFDCTWTNSSAGTERDIPMMIAVQKS